MADLTLVLDRTSALGLQDQLRQRIVEAISVGTLRPGRKMPSSRTLAENLGVSRNTVVLAYAELVAEGHLEARQRSGIFVSRKSETGRIVGRRDEGSRRSGVADRMSEVPADSGPRCPQHWLQYPYPFWDGRIDPTLVPSQEWRKAVRLASSPRDTAQWSAGNGELDDPMLVDELRTKVLPGSGINALPEEILFVSSARQALQFLMTLLLRPGLPVLMEGPVDPELLATLRERGAAVQYCHPRSLDTAPEGAIVITSVRSGIASGAWIGPEDAGVVALRNGVIIELATPADTLESAGTRPALYAAAGSGNIVHVGRLSPVAASGTSLAFIVADAAVIAKLRRLRRVCGALPSLLQQRAWAYFLALGYYAASLHRARSVLTQRKIALRDALNHYLHADVQIETVPGVSAYWVCVRGMRDARAIAQRAAGVGVLIQPARLGELQEAFMMGVTSIPEGRIREGVHALAGVFRAADDRDGHGSPVHRALSGRNLRRAIVGKTFLYNTVYGEPCTIHVGRSGELVGIAGYANEDSDRGRWWIEGDCWYRQWEHWAYGEAEGYRVAVDDDGIRWYDAAGVFVDRAMILGGNGWPRGLISGVGTSKARKQRATEPAIGSNRARLRPSVAGRVREGKGAGAVPETASGSRASARNPLETGRTHPVGVRSRQ